MRRALVAVGCAVVTAAACELVEPREQWVQPAIVVSTPSDFVDRLSEVHDVWLRVTKPGGQPRDTMLVPRVTARGLHARGVLRPDEGEPGTELALTLHAGGFPLFSGVTVLDPSTGWPFEARLTVVPVATFELGGPLQLLEADEFLLGDLSPIVFRDGVAKGSSDIAWSSTNPLVVEIVGDRVAGRAPGTAGVVGVWEGQVDTMSVEVRSHLEFLPGALHYYVGSSDLVVDTVRIEDRRAGGGSLSVSVDAGAPWLSATILAGGPDPLIEVQIDGSTAAAGSAAGQVRVSSAGVPDGSLTVEIDRDPSVGVEVRRWDEFCMFGDSIPSAGSGRTACIDLEARAWTEGQTKRVVLEVRNLNGSLGSDPATAVAFDLQRFGVRLPADLATAATLLAKRRNGSVETIGDPFLIALASLPSDIAIHEGHVSSILGCERAVRAGSGHFRTCDPIGLTGRVRFDLEIADVSWTLAQARAIMTVRVPYTHLGRQIWCLEGETGCHAR